MDMLFTLVTNATLLFAVVLTFAAAIIKGMVGFAMPLIMIAGLSSVMEPSLALAALILPTLATNLLQGFALGVRGAWNIAVRFRVYMLCGMVALLVSAQLVPRLDHAIFFVTLGAIVLAFAAMMLSGWKPRVPPQGHTGVEAAVGAVSGLAGGLAGIWGPPTVAYLTALDLPRREHVATQSVIYTLGAVALFGAHILSGIVQPASMLLSGVLVLPALAGMWIGQMLMGRVSQAAFRRLVLWVLVLAALNLIRRGLM